MSHVATVLAEVWHVAGVPDRAAGEGQARTGSGKRMSASAVELCAFCLPITPSESSCQFETPERGGSGSG